MLAPELDARLREELGMPFLPTVFTLLADHERYLRAATDAFLGGRFYSVEEGGRAARRIGWDAAALIVDAPVCVGSAARPIRALIEAYNQVNPPSLLFTVFLAPEPTSRFCVMEPPLPPPPGHDGEALLADIEACHGGFNLPGFWRELAAGWPQHAASAWSLVRRLPAKAGFSRARAAVVSLATSSLTTARTSRRVAPTPAEVGCSTAEAAEIARILSFYAIVIPTMIVEIECLRQALTLGTASAGGDSAGQGR